MGLIQITGSAALHKRMGAFATLFGAMCMVFDPATAFVLTVFVTVLLSLL